MDRARTINTRAKEMNQAWSDALYRSMVFIAQKQWAKVRKFKKPEDLQGVDLIAMSDLQKMQERIEFLEITIKAWEDYNNRINPPEKESAKIAAEVVRCRAMAMGNHILRGEKAFDITHFKKA